MFSKYQASNNTREYKHYNFVTSVKCVLSRFVVNTEHGTDLSMEREWCHVRCPGWRRQGQGQWYVITIFIIGPTFVSCFWSHSATSPISNNFLSKTDFEPNLITVLASSWCPIWEVPAWQDHLYVLVMLNKIHEAKRTMTGGILRSIIGPRQSQQNVHNFILMALQPLPLNKGYVCGFDQIDEISKKRTGRVFPPLVIILCREKLQRRQWYFVMNDCLLAYEVFPQGIQKNLRVRVIQVKLLIDCIEDGFRIVFNTTNMDISCAERTTERNPGHSSWNLVREGMLSEFKSVLYWPEVTSLLVLFANYTLSNIPESWKSAARLASNNGSRWGTVVAQKYI